MPVKSGLDEAIAKIRKIATSIIRRTHDLMNKTLSDTRNDVIQTMRDTPKQNITIGRRKHRPSQKGNPPAIDHGDLVIVKIASNESTKEYQVGTTEPYGEWLEAPKNVNNARPYMAPQMNKLVPRLAKNIQELLQSEIG